MTIPAIPNQNQLVLPLVWQGTTQKTSMQAAGYTLSGTIGLRPYSSTTTLLWVTDKVTANNIYNSFAATNFNGVYTYTCAIRGTIRVRLNGPFTLQEEEGKPSQISVEVITV